MKALLLSFFAILVFSFSVQAESIKIQEYDGILKSPKFSGPVGIMFGEYGLFQTTNSGATWFDPMQVGVPDITATEMVDDDIFIVGTNSLFGRSLDGGQTWNVNRMEIGQHADFLNIRYLFGWLYIVGTNGTLLLSSDRGESWTKDMTVQTGGAFSDVAIRHHFDHRFMSCQGDEQNNNFWSYTEGFWVPGSVPMENAKTSKIAKNSLNHVFILAENEELGQVIMREIVGDWMYIILPDIEGFVYKDICANTSTFVLANKGSTSRIYRFYEPYHYELWQELPVECNSITFNDEYVFVTQADGGFIHRIPLNTVGINQTSLEIPAYFSLSQNYPNPFNPTTNVNFSLPQKGHVNLTVYDMMGREVEVLVNEVLSAGTYNYSFNGSDVSSGVYFYRLESNDFVETKKMTLIK